MTGMRAASTTGKQRGRPFAKGQSGNPAGRRPGARNKTTLAMEALLDGEAEELTRTAIEMAKGGDTTALRLCFERLLPPRRDRVVEFPLPKLTTIGDAVQASSALVAAASTGELTPSEAADLGKPLGGYLNRRAEMWGKSKEWLEEPAGVQLPDSDSLQADACGPTYKYDSLTRLQIEKKEDMRRRGVHSPDEWDAVALTFAEPVRPAWVPPSKTDYRQFV